MRGIAKLTRSKGITLVEMCVTIAVIIILMGMLSQGFIWAKSQAEITMLTGRAHQIGTALSLYHQENGRFPSAYPAQLETDLAGYIDDDEFFHSPAHPDAGTEPLNSSYVAPIGSDGSRYVLSFECSYDTERAVVLYADQIAETVETLPVLCNGQPAAAGNIVKGGTITFDGGSQIELTGDTVTTVVQSFLAQDGTPFHIVKHTEQEAGGLKATAVDADIVEVASAASLAFLRGGVAEIDFLIEGEDEHLIQVLARSGEVVVDGRAIHESEGSGSGQSENQNLAGYVNINPNNNDDFEFLLEKPNGDVISRDDLHEQGSEYVYAGPAVMIRFKPKGNANQNSLYYNGEPYPVRNGRLYTITASDMVVVLWNDKDKGPSGKAMGRWWLYGFFATDAQIVDGGKDNGGKGKGKDGDDDDDPEEPEGGGEDPPGDDPYAVSSNGRATRSLGRGTTVPKGMTVKFCPYR